MCDVCVALLCLRLRKENLSNTHVKSRSQYTIRDDHQHSIFYILIPYVYVYISILYMYVYWAYTQQIQTRIFWIKLALQLSRRVRAEHLHFGMLSLCCLPASFTYILLFYSCCVCVCVVYHQVDSRAVALSTAPTGCVLCIVQYQCYDDAVLRIMHLV